MKIFFFSNYKLILLFVLLQNLLLLSQPTKNTISHKVQKGETVTQIAQKYKVTPHEILNLNPQAKEGISIDQILIIPVNQGLTVSKNKNTHLVLPKETLFSIAKKYDVSVEQLEQNNPSLKTEGLKAGQELIIFKTKSDNKVASLSENKNLKNHIVSEKETLFSISKLYDISISAIFEANPNLTENIALGSVIKIPLNQKKVEEKAVKSNESDEKIVNGNFLTYQVKPKETLFSLAKNFRISQEKLISLNPELKNGVKEGMILLLPANTILGNEVQKNTVDFTKTLKTDNKKELILLLPFNVSKIESDTTQSIQARLKKDSFLNLTLDFYAGALMAIDSAKRLGVSCEVKIFDSQENKNSSSIEHLVATQNIKNANAIIGPFYPIHIEKTSDLLKNTNLPIISPLREIENLPNNVYQSIPSREIIIDEVLDFFRKENTNFVALIDAKKESTKTYLKNHHDDVKIVSLNEKGSVTYDSLVPLLDKTKTNYFILETAKTSMIFNAINQCNTARKNGYLAEIIALEINETYETDEVFPRVVKQKIIYPSISRSNETEEANFFYRNFKKKNNVLPNQYAIRGFDVTFDTLMRLFQSTDFNENAQNTITHQVENKFDYVKKGKGFLNKGIYILQFDENYQTKILN